MLPHNNSDLQPDDILTQDPYDSILLSSLSPRETLPVSPELGKPNKRKSEYSFPSLSVPLSPTLSSSFSEHNKENIPPHTELLFPFRVGDSVDFYCERPVKKWVMDKN